MHVLWLVLGCNHHLGSTFFVDTAIIIQATF